MQNRRGLLGVGAFASALLQLCTTPLLTRPVKLQPAAGAHKLSLRCATTTQFATARKDALLIKDALIKLMQQQTSQMAPTTTLVMCTSDEQQQHNSHPH